MLGFVRLFAWVMALGIPALAGSIAVTGVTVIDVITGAHRSGVTALTRDDRIVAIGADVRVPDEAARVDGRGKFLIPGLWDMHTHHQGTGADWLDLFVAKGIVGTRDMGGDTDFILPLRERVRSGAVLGPEIVASGPMLDDAPPDFPYRRRVRERLAAEADARECAGVAREPAGAGQVSAGEPADAASDSRFVFAWEPVSGGLRRDGSGLLPAR